MGKEGPLGCLRGQRSAPSPKMQQANRDDEQLISMPARVSQDSTDFRRE